MKCFEIKDLGIKYFKIKCMEKNKKTGVTTGGEKLNFLKNIVVSGLISSMTFVFGLELLAASPENYRDFESVVEKGTALNFPQTLGIIAPKTVSRTTDDNFVVWGTSNPDEPLYMNDQEIVDRLPNGMFEVNVNIPTDGAFSLNFRQGEETKIVPVFKNVDPDFAYNGFAWPSEVLKNTSAIDSSIFPTQNLIMAEKKVKLQCSAPSGARVSATFCDSKFDLKQENPTTQIGVTAKYSLEVDLSAIIEDGKVYDLGNVVYKIDFQGQKTEKTSAGKVYYSKTLPPFVRVSWAYGKLMNGPNSNANVISWLKKGVVDRLVQQQNDFYQLGCGAWINRKFVEPVFENIEMINNISGVKFSWDDKSEKLILEGGGSPVFTSGVAGNILVIKLYNTMGNLDLSSISESSSIFDKVVANQSENFLELVFDLKNSNKLWGYSLDFDDNNIVVSLKKRPELSSDSSKPLEGIVVLVDPGHGGSDSGALGLIGEMGGSAEKDVNLSNSLAIRNRLVSLGANVIMTREHDEYVSLNDRAKLIEQSKPDFVIVVHSDASLNSKAQGATIHFTRNNRFSESFSQTVSDFVSGYTERPNKGIQNTDFYVSGSTWCPTAFCEAGYLTNLKDAASLFSSEKIFDMANAIGDSIIKYLAENNI